MSSTPSLGAIGAYKMKGWWVCVEGNANCSLICPANGWRRLLPHRHHCHRGANICEHYWDLTITELLCGSVEVIHNIQTHHCIEYCIIHIYTRRTKHRSINLFMRIEFTHSVKYWFQSSLLHFNYFKKFK